MKYKVLLTTSGLGQRLGDITKFTNKSLVRVGEKPTLSYIIESYPKDVEIVITVGHFADHVRQFVSLVYPERKITFVEVDRYQGPGSSLAYSIIQARPYIDCPFIFHACDTIVPAKEIIPPDHNWMGGFHTNCRADYASFYSNRDGYIFDVKDKGELIYDVDGFSYIGLAGVFDHEYFFEHIQKSYEDNPNNSQLSDVATLAHMIHHFLFSRIDFSSWHDVGNVDGLRKARSAVKDKFEILDKLEESIFMFDNEFVVKFFYDKEICKNRVTRGKLLSGLVPKILGFTDNFYKYEFAAGQLLASCVNEQRMDSLLDWSMTNLWAAKSDDKFTSKCYDFYYNKTIARLQKFVSESNIPDIECMINGETIPPITDILSTIDLEWLCDGRPVQFHGDFILDNIIYQDQTFRLLDWRQDFAGSLETGDIYYDLAKLNHNLVFNHDIVNKGHFTIEVEDHQIYCDILRSHKLVQCQKTLHRFIQEYSLSLQKINILTALIWINMAPLHHYPLSVFLFYFGKFHLYKAAHELS